MNANKLYKFWGKFSGNGNAAKEFPMKSAREQIYYFACDWKVPINIEAINLTINLKDKRFLETE